jgi:serine/threonine-protein kinase HipA
MHAYLLAVLGEDLPGALTVAPVDRIQESIAPDEGKRDQDQHTPEPVFRFSLAGVQLKFSALMEASGGLTIPAGGKGGSWVGLAASHRTLQKER